MKTGAQTNAPAFGSVIQKYRKIRGLSQPALAEALGVSRNTVTNWETGKNKPDIDLMLRLCARLEIPVQELLGVREDRQSGAERRLLANFRQLSPGNQRTTEKLVASLLQEEARARDEALRDSFRLLEAHSTPAAAGPGCAFNEEPPAYFFVKKNGCSGRADAVVRVSGESMEPLYHSGDLLYLQYADDVPDGADAVCATVDGAVVKRVRNRKLYSLNEDLPYGRKFEDDHVTILGRVLGVVARDELPNQEEAAALEEIMAPEIREFRKRHGLEL